MDSKNKPKLLLIIKVPPPYTGATLMNLYVKNSLLLNSEYEIKSVSISYTKNVDEFGKKKILKIFLFFKYVLTLLKKLLLFKPDLVYFQISTTGTALFRDTLYALLIKLFGCKIIYHLHGKGIETAIKKNGLLRYIVRRAFKNEYVICLSNLVTFDIKDVYTGIPFIVYDGIEKINSTFIDVSKRNNNPPIILYFSNFSVYKGLPIFLEALSILKNYGIIFKSIIAGRDADLTNDQVMKSVKELGLLKDVDIFNNISMESKINLFNRSNIFVFPTIFEAFGTVVLEAMQFSLPVVASDEGSLPIIIDDGISGVLFKNRNSIELASKLKTLLLDENLRVKIGEAGLKMYEDKFTLDKFEKNLNSVFKKILFGSN